jgi:simple sugar transport system ATP-binding protein
MTKALELSGVSKTFDGRVALRNASFDVDRGEVHALLGQNGAGKTTLMNVACGLYAADAGSIAVDGRPASIHEPADAAKLGIGMVHQNFKLVRRFTVAENVLLACGRAAGFRSAGQAGEAAIRKAREVGFEIHLGAVVEDLSLAEQQRLEILKMLLLGARILVLDEPTAVLTDREAEALLSFLRALAARGCAVVLITHKLREVTGFADRVTVMREGVTVLAGAPAGGLDRAALARLMVGETAGEIASIRTTEGAVRLEVAGLSVARPGGGLGVHDLNFSVGAGQIYGVAGIGGNGQSELADALTGLRRPLMGTIRIDRSDVTGRGVPEFRRQGIRAVPADRYRTGLLADLPVYENFGITALRTGRYGGWLSVARRRMRNAAGEIIDQNQILGCIPTTATRLLSGGNAQKLLLARELGEGMSVLIAHSPTRGLDVRACQAVHALIRKAVEAGAACVLISEDLEEILALSTRIAVMSRGRIVGEFPGGGASREAIGGLMLGHA